MIDLPTLLLLGLFAFLIWYLELALHVLVSLFLTPSANLLVTLLVTLFR